MIGTDQQALKVLVAADIQQPLPVRKLERRYASSVICPLGLEVDNPEAFNLGILKSPKPQTELCGHLTDPGLIHVQKEKTREGRPMSNDKIPGARQRIICDPLRGISRPSAVELVEARTLGRNSLDAADAR